MAWVRMSCLLAEQRLGQSEPVAPVSVRHWQVMDVVSRGCSLESIHHLPEAGRFLHCMGDVLLHFGAESSLFLLAH